MNKWRRDARIYSLSWTKTARDVQLELLARIFFLFWGKNHAWRSRDIEYLVILNRFFFVLPFKQDYFPLELQARFFFLFSRKNLVCSTRIRGTLPNHPRQIRTWKERRQEHRLVKLLQSVVSCRLHLSTLALRITTSIRCSKPLTHEKPMWTPFSVAWFSSKPKRSQKSYSYSHQLHAHISDAMVNLFSSLRHSIVIRCFFLSYANYERTLKTVYRCLANPAFKSWLGCDPNISHLPIAVQRNCTSSWRNCSSIDFHNRCNYLARSNVGRKNAFVSLGSQAVFLCGFKICSSNATLFFIRTSITSSFFLQHYQSRLVQQSVRLVRSSALKLIVDRRW